MYGICGVWKGGRVDHLMDGAEREGLRYHTHIVRRLRKSPRTKPRSRDLTHKCCASCRRSFTYHGSQSSLLVHGYSPCSATELGVCVGVQSLVSVSISVFDINSHSRAPM